MRNVSFSAKRLGTAVALTFGLLAFAPTAQAANPLETNFWLSGPRYDGKLPSCESVLHRITTAFREKESSFWNSPLVINGFTRVRETAFRPWKSDNIPRRYCTADALVSNIRPAGLARLGFSYETCKELNPKLVYAVATGLFGGMVVASGMLNVSSAAYIDRVGDALSWSHLGLGLSKAVVFGALIGLVGCYCGLYAKRNAAGVGVATTSAVVVSIVGIIVLDAVFALCANALDI